MLVESLGGRVNEVEVVGSVPTRLGEHGLVLIDAGHRAPLDQVSELRGELATAAPEVNDHVGGPGLVAREEHLVVAPMVGRATGVVASAPPSRRGRARSSHLLWSTFCRVMKESFEPLTDPAKRILPELTQSAA